MGMQPSPLLKFVTKVEVAGAGAVDFGGVGAGVFGVGVVGAGAAGAGVFGAGVLTAGAGALAAGTFAAVEPVLSESLESQPLNTKKGRPHAIPAIAVHAHTLFVIATCFRCCANHADRKRLSTKLELTQPAVC